MKKPAIAGKRAAALNHNDEYDLTLIARPAIKILDRVLPQEGIGDDGPTFVPFVAETGAYSEDDRYVPRGLKGHFTYEAISPDRYGYRFSFRTTNAPTMGDQITGKKKVSERTNSAALRWRGKELVIPRGVPPYKNGVDLEALKRGAPEQALFNNPQGYISRFPLMEMVTKNGETKAVFRRWLLDSIPGRNVVEDPRISTLSDRPGEEPRVLLSYTQVWPKLGTIRNRAVCLRPDDEGLFETPKCTGSGEPKEVINLSPAGIDAKNGTLYINDDGEVVLKTRFRRIAMSRDYGEQVWVFRDWAHFMEYQKNWDDWELHLFSGHFNEADHQVPKTTGQVRTDYAAYLAEHDLRPADPGLFDADRSSSVRPLRVHVAATPESLPEFYPEELLVKRKGKRVNIHQAGSFRGFGPGARPVRLERRGDALYYSAGKHGDQFFAGIIPEDKRDVFPLQPGEVKVFTFDHQSRALADNANGLVFPKRIYSATGKLWDRRAEKIELVYADFIQPNTPDCRGGGIPDLEHVYPEGWAEGEPNDDGIRLLHLYCGVADSSTELIKFDMMALMLELCTDSPRRQPDRARGLPAQIAPPTPPNVPAL